MKRFALMVLVPMLLVGSAWGNTKAIQDPQGDTDGGVEGDIRSATAGHTKTGKLKHTIVMFNKIEGDNRPRVRISLRANDTQATCDNGYEDLFLVGDPSGQLYRLCDGTFYGSFTTKRPNNKTIVYIFAKRHIKSPAKYFWGVASNSDEAPDDSDFYMYGWDMNGVKHRL